MTVSFTSWWLQWWRSRDKKLCRSCQRRSQHFQHFVSNDDKKPNKVLISSKLVARVTPENQMTTTQLGFSIFDCPSKSFLHTSQLAMKHQTNIRWLFQLRKDILYWIEAINLSPVSLFVKPFCLFRLFTTVYTQPRLSRWYIAFCNADSNHFLDFCITAKVVKIISNISAQLVLNTRPLVEFFHCPILFDSVMKKLVREGPATKSDEF